jgi:hypothetical protein
MISGCNLKSTFCFGRKPDTFQGEPGGCGSEPARTPFDPLTVQPTKRRLVTLERGVMMAVDRARLRQALSELVRLKGGAENPTRFLAQLYSSALTEWAGQLGVDQHKLNRLVHVREAGSDRQFY